MAQDADKPKDDGKTKLPTIDAGMNKLGPTPNKGEKPKRRKPIRPAGMPPAYSDSNAAEPEPNEEADAPEEDTNNRGAEDPSDESDAEILKRILKRFSRCVSFESLNRQEALDDLKFKAGDQWPADVAMQRNTDKRPCMTVNKIPTFIHQVTNDQRQNRPSINVSPVGDKGDPDAALMFRGMIRAIERDSSADIAYDTAFDGAVSNGFGYFRILTEYEAPDSFDQIITIKRIRNPFTVYLDPEHQEPDGSDCNFGFVTELIPREEFKDTWPKADPIAFSAQATGESFKDWGTPETIRIAEYFEIVRKVRTYVELENGHTGWKDELAPEVLDKIKSKRMLIVRERESQVPTVMWYKVTQKEILERNVWLGQWIPIIPVIGNEIDLEGKIRYSGLIRDAKDAQRIYNFGVTAEIELVALAPKAPWIVEEGQIEGHEQEWKQSNTRNFPYLSYKGTSLNGQPAPPPQRQGMVGSPVGWINLKQGAAQDMMATTGIRFDPTNADNRVDDSGRAIRELRRSGDLGSFHYVDNLARSLKHCGRQLIDLIPKIYDSKRALTILRENDTEEQITIDPNSEKPYMERQGPNGKTIKIFNPTEGKYGVTVTIGPSYATKRIEASESMMGFAKALPQTAMLIADLIAKNQDWPGAEEMATRLAKAVPPNLLTPDQKDVPPQIQAVMQNMDAQIKQLTEQLQGAMAALNDKDKDRELVQSKIQTDFEAKILAVMQKANEGVQKHIGSHIQNLASDVKSLAEQMELSRAERHSVENR